MISLFHAGCWAAVVMVIVGCGSSGERRSRGASGTSSGGYEQGGACETGSELPCTCGDGSQGWAECGNNGTLGACQGCPGDGEPNSITSSSSSGGNGDTSGSGGFTSSASSTSSGGNNSPSASTSSGGNNTNTSSGGNTSSTASTSSGGNNSSTASSVSTTVTSSGTFSTSSSSSSSSSSGNNPGSSSGGAAPPSTNDVIISEYVEGSGNNKALELFNGTDSVILLSNYQLDLYANGAVDPEVSDPLWGMVQPGDVFVLCYANATGDILSKCDAQTHAVNFNGNDRVELLHNGQVVDIFGDDTVPEVGWGDGLTRDHTLRRGCNVHTGWVNGWDFDPLQEWSSSAMDDFSGLGSHCGSQPGGNTGGTEACSDGAALALPDGFTNSGPLEVFWAAGMFRVVQYIYSSSGHVIRLVSFDSDGQQQGNAVDLVNTTGDLYWGSVAAEWNGSVLGVAWATNSPLRHMYFATFDEEGTPQITPADLGNHSGAGDLQLVWSGAADGTFAILWNESESSGWTTTYTVRVTRVLPNGDDQVWNHTAMDGYAPMTAAHSGGDGVNVVVRYSSTNSYSLSVHDLTGNDELSESLLSISNVQYDAYLGDNVVLYGSAENDTVYVRQLSEASTPLRIANAVAEPDGILKISSGHLAVFSEQGDGYERFLKYVRVSSEIDTFTPPQPINCTGYAYQARMAWNGTKAGIAWTVNAVGETTHFRVVQP